MSTKSKPKSSETLNKPFNSLQDPLGSGVVSDSYGVGMTARQLGLLIKVQNRRVDETLKRLATEPDDPCLCEELRVRCSARDVFVEMLSAYLDLYDEAEDHDTKPGSYHPFIVSG